MNENTQSTAKNQIISSKEAYLYLKEKFQSDSEEFWAIALSSSKKILNDKLLFKGTVDACLIHPRDIFRFAYLANATSIIIAHNHPSNDPRPSTADIQITQKIYRASKMLQLPILDHIIITDYDYFSFADQGLKPFGKRTD